MEIFEALSQLEEEKEDFKFVNIRCKNVWTTHARTNLKKVKKCLLNLSEMAFELVLAEQQRTKENPDAT